MTPVVVAVGGNIRPRRRTLLSGLSALARTPGVHLVALSTLRETEPVDAPPGSGKFLNGACLLHTTLAPRALLIELQRIEREHGRVPEPRNAPRPLDLDIILFGGKRLAEPDLVVPHPRATERDFVLVPAAEVAPRMTHPATGLTLAELTRPELVASRGGA